MRNKPTKIALAASLILAVAFIFIYFASNPPAITASDNGSEYAPTDAETYNNMGNDYSDKQDYDKEIEYGDSL
jgi:hypothetical protein